MSSGWILLLTLLVGMALGIIIQFSTTIIEILRDPDRFEENAIRAAETSRSLRNRMGR